MNRFPAVDAALEGFRITREHPRAVLAWGALVFILNVAGQAWLLHSGAMGAWSELFPGASLGVATPPGEVVARLRAAAPAFLTFAPIAAGLNIILYTAVFRTVLEPGRSARAYLRLGIDELRQVVLMLLILGAWIVYAAVLDAVSLRVLGLIDAGLGAAGGLPKAAVLAAMVIALLYPVIRLSLAPATTFAEGRISLLRSWSMTRGHVWGLLGAYALAAVLAGLVMLLTALIFAALGAMASIVTQGGFDLLSAATQKKAMTLSRLFTPASLALAATNAVSSALGFVIVMAVGPSAYRSLAGRADLRA